ncbi:hypothetical protein LXD69_04380 [Flavobacterium sediminilitoris]|uniref:YD repeat-containing protein n=2 Tax=Flavobacterium TaxID=237 RepID=A0ABY4HQ34_9FLAO|nr:JAB-like toxin 1 domain-containing protein [Flavobacterium sediminilitoris]UOX34746.1 hypothetical protein LXD69_04380 [Flavobacterium sediminilitoris]
MDKNSNINRVDNKKYYDAKGNEVDRLYSESGNFIEISDLKLMTQSKAPIAALKNILPSKSNPNKTVDLNAALTKNIKDAYNLFYFAGTETDVEWSLTQHKGSKFVLSTNHHKDFTYTTESYNHFGLSVNTLQKHYHTHPGDYRNGPSAMDVTITSNNAMFRMKHMDKSTLDSSVPAKYFVFHGRTKNKTLTEYNY